MAKSDKLIIADWEAFCANIRKHTPEEELSQADLIKKKAWLEARPVEWMRYFFPAYASAPFADFQNPGSAASARPSRSSSVW